MPPSPKAPSNSSGDSGRGTTSSGRFSPPSSETSKVLPFQPRPAPARPPHPLQFLLPDPQPLPDGSDPKIVAVLRFYREWIDRAAPWSPPPNPNELPPDYEREPEPQKEEPEP